MTINTMGNSYTVTVKPGETLAQSFENAHVDVAAIEGLDVLLDPTNRQDAASVTHSDVEHNAEYTAPPKNRSLGC